MNKLLLHKICKEWTGETDHEINVIIVIINQMLLDRPSPLVPFFCFVVNQPLHLNPIILRRSLISRWFTAAPGDRWLDHKWSCITKLFWLYAISLKLWLLWICFVVPLGSLWFWSMKLCCVLWVRFCLSIYLPVFVLSASASLSWNLPSAKTPSSESIMHTCLAPLIESVLLDSCTI